MRIVPTLSVVLASTILTAIAQTAPAVAQTTKPKLNTRELSTAALPAAATASVKTSKPQKEALPPKPIQWTATEIAAAQRACKRILKNAQAIATPVPPIKKGPCGDPAPVRLIQIGKVPVTFDPPPIMNCKMVAALAKWIRSGLQRHARKFVGARLTRVSVMSSYSCRNAYGRSSTRLSEHAKANALDIGGFEFGDGLKARLLAHWGPTQRDIVARAKAQERHHATERTKHGTPKSFGAARASLGSSTIKNAARALPSARRVRTALVPVPRPNTGSLEGRVPKRPNIAALPESSTHARWSPPLPMRKPSLKERMQWVRLERLEARRKAESQARRLSEYRAKLQRFLYAAEQLGGPKSKHAGAPRLERGHADPNRRAFLKAAWRSACKIFGTVLGPEANEAHRNHFHVDLAHRRRANYCR